MWTYSPVYKKEHEYLPIILRLTDCMTNSGLTVTLDGVLADIRMSINHRRSIDISYCGSPVGNTSFNLARSNITLARASYLLPECVIRQEWLAWDEYHGRQRECIKN